ncbi:hypothetical protein [Bordetella genomosp. 11]|uniref:Uncharacterized protein n=1 Tax=Bordetella genomosp. 11 TaxID=1416808 RepID=A0A261UI41_9BORD|nr:hypothetical protein [Bordetella genomosp. 11]OZI61579.1 hypothetical protein CAL28_20055 [Bordetella genomosp. 11]
MGCDIHLYKEKHIGGRWVTADEWVPDDYGDGDKGKEVPWDKRFTRRNYELFGLLSKGVRSEHPYSFEPRGIPFNPCEEIADQAENWGSDGHSHSYLYLHEMKDMLAFLESQTILVSGMKDKEELAKLQATIDAGKPDWNLLFPYAGWTSQQDWVEFTMDVPAMFYVGEALKEIISGFDGVDGDNHRIVFFFDN